MSFIKRSIIFVLAISLTLFSGSLSAAPKKFVDYSKHLSSADKKNIQYIINTLANNSVFKLMTLKKDLELAGDKVSYVHPLKFLSYIYSDSSLNANMKKISSIPWKRFSSDMSDSLNHAYNEGLIKTEQMEQFAKSVKVDPKKIEPYFKSRNWQGMMDYFRNRA